MAHSIAASLKRELPEAQRVVVLRAEGAVRYVCPQRIAYPAPLPAALPMNLRVAREVRGELRLHGGGREIWSARRHLLPERRILVPTPAQLPAGVDALTVEIGAPHRHRSSSPLDA